jgi:hypothetical protein
LEKPKAMSFSVQELYTVCNDQILRTGIFADKDCETLNSEEEAVGQLKTEDSVESFGIGKALEKAEQNTFVEDGISEKGEIVGAEANFLGKDGSVDEAESVSEDCSLRFCSEPETICSVGELSDSDHIIDSIIHDFWLIKESMKNWNLKPFWPMMVNKYKIYKKFQVVRMLMNFRTLKVFWVLKKLSPEISQMILMKNI